MIPADGLHGSRILIVDDQEANVALLERLLERAGYSSITATTDSRKVVPLVKELDPDLILLDLHMPHLDGFAVLEALKGIVPEDTYLPVVVLTADITPDVKRRALEAGARDFLTKPVDTVEVRLRLKNLLETRFLHVQLQRHNRELEERVRLRTQELEQAQAEILDRLARAAEYRDDDTGEHTQRVGNMSARLARRLGFSDPEVELIRQAAPLHDVGKIGIPDQVLLKPGRLTPEEFEVIKTHAIIGDEILKGSRFPVLRLAEEIAKTHQERWDGTGYPQGLSGTDIPLVGRLVAVADVYDALTNERPYKRAWPQAEALAEIELQRGKQFDPEIVDAFLGMMRTAADD